MKKILILAIMLTLGNANACTDYIKNASKNMELGNNESSYILAKTYMELSVKSLIRAKYSCNESLTPQLEDSIANTKKKISRLKR